MAVALTVVVVLAVLLTIITYKTAPDIFSKTTGPR
jgi:hypothetical protein